MAINLKLKSGINENSVKYKELLSNLQSNILKGHNRKYVKLIFLQFFGSQQEVKNWISKLNVTSAMKQVEDSNIRRSDTGSDTDYDGGLIKNFFLTAEGYEELGFETQKFRKNGNRIFLKGMKSKRARRALNDPPVENWQDDYSEDIDAMILLADKKSSVLDAEVEEIRNEIETFAQVVIIESGNKLSDDKEHFGYVDGISNPKYYKRDAEKEATKRGGINKNNPIRPLSEILIKDPFGKRGLDHFGSFFVYRKLSQNVKGFNKKVKALGENVKLTEEQKVAGITKDEYAGALVVGRYKNGTPLAISAIPNENNAKNNNFNYKQEDPKGMKCPFHAHIRKTNPRDDARIFDSIIPDRFITRRAIPYGDKNDNNDKGLLFMCFQSSLKKQFNFIQKKWANKNRFPPLRNRPGIDPIISSGNSQDDIQTWPKSYNSEEEFDFHFESFVTMLGGEYFFAPSIYFIKNINKR